MSPRVEQRHRPLTYPATEATVPVETETDRRQLLAAVHRWARTHGWHASHTGWINAPYVREATIAVDVIETGVAIRRKLSTAPGFAIFPHRPDEYAVGTVRQGVDVLCALGILPPELSGQYAAGVDATLSGATARYDRDGDRWWLQWISERDTPGMTRSDVELECGPLTVDPPSGEPAAEQPGPYCRASVPGAPIHVRCGTTAVGTILDGDGRRSPVCQAHAELAAEVGLTVTPLSHPAARAIVAQLPAPAGDVCPCGHETEHLIKGGCVAQVGAYPGRRCGCVRRPSETPPARLTPAERIAEVAAIAPEYVRPVETAVCPDPWHSSPTEPIDACPVCSDRVGVDR